MSRPFALDIVHLASYTLTGGGAEDLGDHLAQTARRRGFDSRRAPSPSSHILSGTQDIRPIMDPVNRPLRAIDRDTEDSPWWLW